ncbi:MAG: hypothetical protein ABIV39_00010 [Verrucomicrobiota bacterium]
MRQPCFAGNYGLSGAITLAADGIVDYAATNVSQTVNSSLVYGTLRISGSGIKSLPANLLPLNSTTAAAGIIFVASGILDLNGFTPNRGTTVAGGTFTVSAGATLKIPGTNSFPSNYTTHSLATTSTVEYNGTNQTISAETYGNLILSSGVTSTKAMPAAVFTVAGNLSSTTNAGGASVSYTAGAAITVNGSITIGSGTTFNGGSFAHSIGANWTNNGTFSGSTGTVTMNGANGVLTGTGSTTFNNLTLARSGITMTTNTSVTLSGNMVTTGAGTFTHVTGGMGKVTLSGVGRTVAGAGINFNHLTVSGSVGGVDSLRIGGNLVISGALNLSVGTLTLSGAGSSISGAGTLALNALNVPGSVSTTNSFSVASDLSVAGGLTATAGTVSFLGTSSFSGSANLFNVTLNGTRLTPGSGSALGVAGVFALAGGIFDVTSSVPNTVIYNGAGPQAALGTTYDNLTFSGSGTKTNLAALSVNRDWTISSGAVFNAGPFTNTLQRHWVNNGTFNAGASAMALTGSADSSIAGATTFNTLTIDKSSGANVVMLQTNIAVTLLNLNLGGMDTGTKALTITGTRTGGGIIFGTIIRTHSFSTGVAYAFEGTNNTVNFASASGVSSVTMTVKPGAVSDFPFGSSLNREYAVSVTASGAYNATLSLHYQDSELNGDVEANLELWRQLGSWSSIGKSANDAANNWVERSGQTNLAGRWTISDNASVVVWNGSVSSAWENPANWTAIQGAPSLPPSSNDVVELGAGNFLFQPAIASAVFANSIFMGSTQVVSLTLGAGGALTVLGNIDGTWSQNATHSINVGNQTLNVGGSVNPERWHQRARDQPEHRRRVGRVERIAGPVWRGEHHVCRRGQPGHRRQL